MPGALAPSTRQARTLTGPFRPDGRVENRLPAGRFDSGIAGSFGLAKLVWHDRRTQRYAGVGIHSLPQ